MAVGIVMLNYNGSDVLALTLDSMLRAQVDTPFYVCLVDNGSKPEDHRQAQNAFSAFSQRKGGDKDQFIRSETNLGFAVGNNLGFQTLLKDPTVTHICCLNTDVIV
ncbi:MAG: glycosyltransferase, partial [Clostridia bacterium]